MPIISSKTRVASTNRIIINQLVSNNENIHLLTNRSFLLNAKTAFRAAPASAASSCPSSAWFEFDLFDQQQYRNCIEIECHSKILSPDLPSGMDAATTHQTGLQRARDQTQPNSNSSNKINNNNLVSNAYRKIISVDNDDDDNDLTNDDGEELNGNDFTMNMNSPKESRIKFRITENPMNTV